MKSIPVILIAGLFVSTSMNVVEAKQLDKHVRRHATTNAKMRPGTSTMRGNNAELGGNNGNSASGSNSLTNPNNPGSTGSGL